MLTILLSCTGQPPRKATLVPAPTEAAPETDCSTAKNTCADYSPYWVGSCPDESRCITFTNSCPDTIALAYNIGCDGDGKGGAPQCSCTDGPTIKTGNSVYWSIVDGDYTSCLPSWTPACLTASLAVIANTDTADCTAGTRVEFTAGNSADPYGRFDAYDIDVEKLYYSVPLSFEPDLTCAVDHENHDCRPVYCSATDCPDAYSTPTTGGCADGRSPQVGCQDTFSQEAGLTVEFCPSDCATTGGSCPSCLDAKACP